MNRTPGETCRSRRNQCRNFRASSSSIFCIATGNSSRMMQTGPLISPKISSIFFAFSCQSSENSALRRLRSFARKAGVSISSMLSCTRANALPRAEKNLVLRLAPSHSTSAVMRSVMNSPGEFTLSTSRKTHGRCLLSSRLSTFRMIEVFPNRRGATSMTWSFSIVSRMNAVSRSRSMKSSPVAGLPTGNIHDT